MNNKSIIKKILFILFGSIILLVTFYFFLNYPYKLKVQEKYTRIIELITFKKQKYEELEKELDRNILKSKFGKLKLNIIELNKRDFDKPLGYLETINGNIIYLGANGDLLLIDDNFSKKEIKNNLNSFFNNEIKKDDLFVPYIVNPIRDLLYHNGFLYVVFLDVKLINDEVVFSSSVLKGKLNFDHVDFKYFFKPGFFINPQKILPGENNYSLAAMHSGGRIVVDKNDNFFISVPDYFHSNLAQDKNNIFGKVLQIQSIEDFKVISIGHRNPQGFYYDNERNIFIESEHGPTGGDELNIIKLNKNYGWPNVSTGIIPNYYTKLKKINYSNHKKQGYYPPIYSWPIRNPGISQIIKIKKNSKFNFRNLYMVGSLSGSNYYNGNHLYLFSIDENKATLKDKIFIRDRVRDLVYDEFNDKIILALENQEAIGIIEAK
tara:strand:+ start:2092 stop:3393 length:1302 start_codon:yes stop_codon:yes gene_type:complete